MTPNEQQEFREQYQRIVWLCSDIASSNIMIRNLSQWDKNGSHKDAILKEQQIKKSLQERLTIALNGRDYEEWKVINKKLSKLNSRLRTAQATVNKCETEINNLLK